MRRVVVLAALVAYVCLVAYAVTAMKKTVAEMAAEADHVIVGHVTKVDMIDHRGRPSREISYTSLSEPDFIRLHVEPQRALKGGEEIPETLVLPLWRGWGHSFEDMKDDMQDEEFVFFLRGPKLDPLFLGEFYIPAEDMAEVVNAIIPGR